MPMAKKANPLFCVSCGCPAGMHKLVHPWNSANGPRPIRCRVCSKVCVKKGKNYYFDPATKK